MSFAIIETGGKQYKVKEGDVLSIEQLAGAEKGKEVVFDHVLLVHDGEKTTIGEPYIKDAKVKAELTESGRGKKISILKFKNKTRYRKLLGHRQPYNKIKIGSLK